MRKDYHGYESPYRLNRLLKELKEYTEVLGSKVSRELTKKFERHIVKNK